MTARRLRASNTAIYLIAILVIIIAFVLLGGGPWLRGMIHGNYSYGFYSLNWTQILISLGIGFLIGWLVARR
jgi:hypothetical protein